MRSVITGLLIAISGGVVGAALASHDTFSKTATDRSADIAKHQPAGFWTTPAVKGYGDIHYDRNAAFSPLWV